MPTPTPKRRPTAPTAGHKRPGRITPAPPATTPEPSVEAPPKIPTDYRKRAAFVAPAILFAVCGVFVSSIVDSVAYMPELNSCTAQAKLTHVECLHLASSANDIYTGFTTVFILALAVCVFVELYTRVMEKKSDKPRKNPKRFIAAVFRGLSVETRAKLCKPLPPRPFNGRSVRWVVRIAAVAVLGLWIVLTIIGLLGGL